LHRHRNRKRQAGDDIEKAAKNSADAKSSPLVMLIPTGGKEGAQVSSEPEIS